MSVPCVATWMQGRKGYKLPSGALGELLLWGSMYFVASASVLSYRNDSKIIVLYTNTGWEQKGCGGEPRVSEHQGFHPAVWHAAPGYPVSWWVSTAGSTARDVGWHVCLSFGRGLNAKVSDCKKHSVVVDRGACRNRSFRPKRWCKPLVQAGYMHGFGMAERHWILTPSSLAAVSSGCQIYGRIWIWQHCTVSGSVVNTVQNRRLRSSWPNTLGHIFLLEFIFSWGVRWELVFRENFLKQCDW